MIAGAAPEVSAAVSLITANAVAEGVNRVVRKWVLIALAVYVPVWFAGQILESVHDVARQARAAEPTDALGAPYKRTMTDAELEAVTERNRREVQRMIGKRP